MKQNKGPDSISGVSFAFGSYMTGVIDMKSKEVSIRVKEAIILVKKTNNSIRELPNTFRVSKSTILVHTQKERMHFGAQQHQMVWKTWKDNKRG